MKRLTVFVKGNVDVRDSLHFCRIGGEVVWNGINEVLRARDVERSVRVKHETWTRSDALLECGGTVPAAFAGRDLPLGAYSLASQFSNAIFTTTADAIVLSIQPDVTMSLMRHRREKFLFYPSDVETWAADDQVWLRSDYETSGMLSVDVAMNNLAALIARIRDHSEAPILIYNLSPIIPGEQVHCYGQGRHKQIVTTIVDTDQQSHADLLIHRVLQGQISLSQAFEKLHQAIRSRGARESLAMLASGVARLIGRRT